MGKTMKNAHKVSYLFTVALLSTVSIEAFAADDAAELAKKLSADWLRLFVTINQVLRLSFFGF